MKDGNAKYAKCHLQYGWHLTYFALHRIMDICSGCAIFRSKNKALKAALPSSGIFMCVWVGTYHILREKTEIEKMALGILCISVLHISFFMCKTLL